MGEQAGVNRSIWPLSLVDPRWHALLRYLVIGGLSIVIDVGLLFVLHHYAKVSVGPATALAYVVSLLFNFMCNRVAMSAPGNTDMSRHALRYAILVVANLLITVTVVTGASHAGVPYLWAKVAVVAASTCWNFVLYRRWVFAPRA